LATILLPVLRRRVAPKVACSCKPGTEGAARCNYGRSCGTLRVSGRDVGQILIVEGLAVPFRCGATNCPPTPSPWCRYPRRRQEHPLALSPRSCAVSMVPKRAASGWQRIPRVVSRVRQ
jgi:hypothetical protein